MRHIYAKVKVGMKKEYLKEKSENHFEISVREKAELNMANVRVLEILANHFNIPASKIRILKGHKKPSKLFVIE